MMGLNNLVQFEGIHLQHSWEKQGIFFLLLLPEYMDNAVLTVLNA